MRNHIVFKFLAVALAALMLTCAALSGVGLLLLSVISGDAPPAEVLQEEYQSSASHAAANYASNYASRALGNCPEDLAEFWYPRAENFSLGYVRNYTIADEGGNILEGVLPDRAEFLVTYQETVSGKYLEILENVPVTTQTDTYEYYESEDTGVLVFGNRSDALDRIAENGSIVSNIQISTQDGSSSSNASGSNMGILFHNQGGDVVFYFYGHLSFDFFSDFADEAVEILLVDQNGDVVYMAPLEPGELRAMENGNYLLTPSVEAAEPSETPGDTEGSDGSGDEAEDGALSETTHDGETTPEATETVNPEAIQETTPDSSETVPEVTEDAAPEATEATVPVNKEATPSETPPVSGNSVESLSTFEYYNYGSQSHHVATGTYRTMPGYTVTLYLVPNTAWEAAESILTVAYEHQPQLVAAFGVSLLLFVMLTVYLCCAAGRTPGSDEIRPGGLNRVPIDLYALVSFGALTCAILLLGDGTDYYLGQGLPALSIVLYGCYFCALLLVGLIFAFAAQVKTPGLFLLKNSLCGLACRLCLWCVRILWRGCVWVLRRIRSLWRKLWEKLHSVFAMLPLTWQWLLTAMGMFLLLVIGFASRSFLLMCAAVIICIAIVLYGIYAFGLLLKGAKAMRGGDLNAQVDSRNLIGVFRTFAEELNGLSQVAIDAARKQMKSERMRAELITNVSHDIKTPLTSIINYVDLLQKPHTPEQEEGYLEVLSRQSSRMKKLIDDLMEMSKASTGNISVEITRVDVAEAVNQALGEFADKLAAANLTPVFHQPEEPVMMLADGRLAWRAMSNLLSNAVKYALPGTRLYIDLAQVNGTVAISMKNISREMLNISADELMERFVRGDTSRNTEGSGLGLNIAKSIMELQKGQLQLLVDGDLFKATLIFPGA